MFILSIVFQGAIAGYFSSRHEAARDNNNHEGTSGSENTGEWNREKRLHKPGRTEEREFA